MNATFDDQLAALYESSKGGAGVPRDVLCRLKFVARVLPQAASSAGGAAAVLVWLDSTGQAHSMAVQAGPGVVIGRETTCDIVLAHPRVSRQHCVVGWRRRNPSTLEVEDLGSTNGTLVNGLRLAEFERRQLCDGDVLEAGGIALAVLLPAETPKNNA